MSDNTVISTPQPLTDDSKTNPPLAPPPTPMQTTSTSVVSAPVQTPYSVVTSAPNDSVATPKDSVSPVSIHPFPVIASEPSNQESTPYTPVSAALSSIDKPLDDSKQQMINELLEHTTIPPKTTIPTETESSRPQDSTPKRKSGKNILLALIATLFLTLPIGVYYITQQNSKLAELRSSAYSCTGPEEQPWSECSSIGGKGCSPKNNCLECKSNTSGGPSKTWAPCGGTPTCPWTETNGKCCPKGQDACSNIGATICIDDPFVSECTSWDGGCGGGYWKATRWAGTVEELRQFCGAHGTPAPKPTKVPCIGNSCSRITPTDEPNNPTNTPTSTPIPSEPICRDIKVYKGTTQVTPSTLRAGNAVTIAVVGTKNPTKARFRVNGAQIPGDTDADPNWTISTRKNTKGEYFVSYTIPTGVTSFLFESETFAAGAWR